MGTNAVSKINGLYLYLTSELSLLLKLSIIKGLNNERKVQSYGGDSCSHTLNW